MNLTEFERCRKTLTDAIRVAGRVERQTGLPAYVYRQTTGPEPVFVIVSRPPIHGTWWDSDGVKHES